MLVSAQICEALPYVVCRAVSQAELQILRNRESTAAPASAVPQANGSALPAAFAGPTLSRLRKVGQSGVARTSLQARHRWDAALRKVLVMLRVCRAFSQSKM